MCCLANASQQKYLDQSETTRGRAKITVVGQHTRPGSKHYFEELQIIAKRGLRILVWGIKLKNRAARVLTYSKYDVDAGHLLKLNLLK